VSVGKHHISKQPHKVCLRLLETLFVSASGCNILDCTRDSSIVSKYNNTHGPMVKLHVSIMNLLPETAPARPQVG
jgi:hypothetical protein